MVAAERCYRLVIDPAFQRFSLKLWRYRHDPDGPRQMWMAIVDDPGETAGRTFAAGLRLGASVQMEVMVSLGRLGEADYEGSSRSVRREAGEPRHIRFTKNGRASRRDRACQNVKISVGGES